MNVTTYTPAEGHRHSSRDYSQNPLLVYWEMTQACALACRHCRAEAMPRCHPNELTTAESTRLLRQIAGFGDPLPHLILTGGDPLRRPDLYTLIAEAQALGLRVSITPSASEALTPDVVGKLRKHHIQSLGLSLDGSTPARHEAVRGVKGCFDWTMRATLTAGSIRLPVQINTLVSQETVEDLPAIYELLMQMPVMRWSLFFLIAVGRGTALGELPPNRVEQIMHWICNLVREAPFAIKTTEAPFYRRVALNHMQDQGLAPDEIRKTGVYQGFGIRDGHGIVFVSNTGKIYPSGFLPLAAGNVRGNRLADVYRESALFRSLHAPDTFKGKCGECEYRRICGGSRARAFAHTGDPTKSDPACPYWSSQEKSADKKDWLGETIPGGLRTK